MDNTKDYVILWEAPKLIPPEFRLYYDDKGNVICYSGSSEKLEGKYIVIDALTFAMGRPDVRVIDGRISTVAVGGIVTKLMPNDHDGIECCDEDISIVLPASYTGKKQKWKVNTYELT